MSVPLSATSVSAPPGEEVEAHTADVGKSASHLGAETAASIADSWAGSWILNSRRQTACAWHSVVLAERHCDLQVCLEGGQRRGMRDASAAEDRCLVWY